jgi:glycosyltransferase involved in cell wall biosynthesis
VDRPSLLYVLHEYFYHAGVQKRTQELVAALSDRFRIAVAYRQPGAICLLREGRVERWPVTTVPVPATPYHLADNEAALARVLEAVRPDVVHVRHFLHWPLSVIDQLVDCGAPVIVGLHDFYAVTPHWSLEGVRDVREAFDPALVRRVFGDERFLRYLEERRVRVGRSLARAAMRVTPSDWMAGQVETVFAMRPTVVENGCRDFIPLPRAPSPGVRFGFLGNRIPNKGWTDLVEAFERARARFPALRLVFHGAGPVLEPTRPGIDFHPVFGNEDLARIMSGIDVGVIPSRVHETFSTTLSEMWRGGLPVIVSGIGALGDRVIDGENGRKVPPRDVDALAEALAAFARDDGWRRWILPCPPTVAAMVERYERLYRALIKG